MSDKDYLKRPCPLCGSDKGPLEVRSARRAEDLDLDQLRPYWTGFFKGRVFFSYKRCSGCGLLYCPVFYTQEQLKMLYASMAPNMDVVPNNALRGTQAGYYDALKQYGLTGGGDYIEIGPDVGLFTEHAVNGGQFTKFWLFEPNLAVLPQLTMLMGDHKHQFVHDLFDLDKVPDYCASLVVMIHVLDHLLDPLATLREIKAKMIPNGRLVIVTHNEGSALARLLGSRWPAYCVQHPQVYRPASMAKLLTAAGFSSLRIEKTINIFPVQFLIKQALWAIKFEVTSVPKLGGAAIGLKLGNIISLATS